MLEVARLAVQGARAARPRPAFYRRLLYRLGALLVAWGSHLQAYAERPELEAEIRERVLSAIKEGRAGDVPGVASVPAVAE